MKTHMHAVSQALALLFSIMPASGRRAACLLGLMLIAGCDRGPREISFGKEECAHCRMTVTDPRFAAELVTTTSKTYVYDAVECMAAFLNEKKIPESDVASLWVMRHDQPGDFINAEKAWYRRAEDVKSPMGLDCAAYVSEEDYRKACRRAGEAEPPTAASVDSSRTEGAEAADLLAGAGSLYRWTSVRLLAAKEM